MANNAQPLFAEIQQTLKSLEQAPLRLKSATTGVQPARVQIRSEAEPWSVSDILAHLWACADVWGTSIIAMVTRENPTLRYVSPRSVMKKPKYQSQEFAAALEAFTEERQKLVQTLLALDEAGWLRGATFSGVSDRQRNQTVFSFVERIVSHEQPHLEQIESLLKM